MNPGLKIKEHLIKNEFNPGLTGLFTNPFYFSRKGLFKAISTNSGFIKGKVLDVGCGSKPYKNLFSWVEYTGIDIAQNGHDHQNEEIDIYYDGKNIPFNSGEFDSAVSFEVLEHVFNPDELLKEIHRILKNEGILMITVPFVWDEHEQPYDYARYSSFGLKFLFEKNGFELLKQERINNTLSVIFQLMNAYLFKILLKRRSVFMKYLLTFIFCAPVNIVGSFFSKILPRNDDLYLDNIIVAKKI